jgi:hypothetical protein
VSYSWMISWVSGFIVVSRYVVETQAKLLLINRYTNRDDIVPALLSMFGGCSEL